MHISGDTVFHGNTASAEEDGLQVARRPGSSDSRELRQRQIKQAGTPNRIIETANAVLYGASLRLLTSVFHSKHTIVRFANCGRLIRKLLFECAN